MFRLKTPNQFALIFSAFITLIVILVLQLILSYYDSSLSLGPLSLIGFILIAISYGLVYFLLEIFVNRKLRLLYRMIHNFQASKADYTIDMNEDVLAASETDVIDWVNKSREELVKLKEQEEFRKEFIGNLAHELKTPMFSIQGYILTLLEGGLDDQSVNEKFLKRALKGVDRMNLIIGDLDMIAKFESQRTEMVFQPNDIVQISKDVMDGLELKAKEKAIKLKFAKIYNDQIMVSCDSGKIGQVLQNLISNAIQYSNVDGEIVLRFISLGKSLIIEVEDDGIGIEEEHFSRLFERFYRVDKSRARHEGGTGLGLAIVKHIVEAHGQTISIRSSINRGSTFFFTLSKV
jgi:two-component system phosphate regulon sensor histidine kinase PhoR